MPTYSWQRISNVWQDNFRHLQSVLTKPEALIGEVEILARSERQQLLVEFNNTQLDYGKTSVSTTCLKTGREYTRQHSCCLEDRQLTYAELNTRANQLAHTYRG